MLLAVNTIVFGLAVELLFVGSFAALYQVILIDEHNAPLLVCGVFAIFNFAVVSKLRAFGVANLNFEIHENALNKLLTPPESWSNVVMAFLDESIERSNELEILVQLIEEAPGAVERQDRRTEAKNWLRNNWDKLTDEDREFVRENLGYLHLTRPSS